MRRFLDQILIHRSVFARPNPTSRTTLCAASIGVALLFLANPAQAASPTLTRILPGGGQRGTEVEVTCEGKEFLDARGLLFYDRGLEVTSVSQLEFTKFKAKIKIAPDAALGEHLVRVWTATGVGDMRTFYVTPYPLVAKAEKPKDAPKNAPKDAPKDDLPQPVALGTTIWGTIQGEAVDRFIFDAKKGQRISAEVVGMRLQPREIFDPILTLLKADGTTVAENDDNSLLQQDPVISALAPADGKYIVALRDATNDAPSKGCYLLHLGSFPRPLAVYPAGGQAGEALKVTYLGDAGGPLSAVLKLPAHPDDHFPVFPEQKGSIAPSPNWLRVSSFPNVLEVEPNNTLATATATDKPLPLALNGVIGEKGDVDYFRFAAKKDQDLDVNVFARRLRSPLDSILEIYDEKGKSIAQNDDSGGPDSYLRWKVPADGNYYLSIKDHLGRGGPTYTYRVELTPVKSGLTVWLPEIAQDTQERQTISVPRGNRYASMVRIKRENYTGDVTIVPSDLPAGVTMIAPAGQGAMEAVPAVFEATATAPVATKTFTLAAKPADGKPVESRVAHPVDIVSNGNEPYYRIFADKLAIAVGEEAPIKLSLIAPQGPIAQTGNMNLKVVAERKAEFKSVIHLKLLYAPPGIGTAGSAEIKEGDSEGVFTISASGDAVPKTWKIAVLGWTDSGHGNVWVSTQFVDLEVLPLFVSGQISRAVAEQGDKTTVTVKLQQKVPFEGKAKLQLLGLPGKATAPAKEITKDDTEVKFEVQTDKATPVGKQNSLFCQLEVLRNGVAIPQNIAQGGILRIDAAATANRTGEKK